MFYIISSKNEVFWVIMIYSQFWEPGHRRHCTATTGNRKSTWVANEQLSSSLHVDVSKQLSNIFYTTKYCYYYIDLNVNKWKEDHHHTTTDYHIIEKTQRVE